MVSPLQRPSSARPLPAVLVGLVAGLLTATAACGSGEPAQKGRTFSGGPPVCEKGPARPSGTVQPDITEIGPSSNAIDRAGGKLWIVESGANTVSTWDLRDQNWKSGVLDVGAGRNPFEIALSDGRAYVTNWLSNSVSVARTSDGEILTEIENDAFGHPQDVVATDDRLYVTNVELHGRNDFGPGSVTVVDRESHSVSHRVETAWKNPQFARLVETPDGRRLAVSDAGAIAIADGEAELRSPGGLELWTLDGGPPNRETFELGHDPDGDIGAPGRPLPTPDGRYLYFTSATAPVLFKFDLQREQWVRGVDNPIRLYDAEGNALHHGAMGRNGVIYVTAFNRDALYLFDTTCDKRLAGPIELGTAPDQLEGPQRIVTVPRGRRVDAYFITLSNALGRVRLEY